MGSDLYHLLIALVIGATNMAGRGTDIMLGGNPEFLANAALIQKGLDPEENLEQYNHAYLS